MIRRLGHITPDNPVLYAFGGIYWQSLAYIYPPLVILAVFSQLEHLSHHCAPENEQEPKKIVEHPRFED